MPNLRTLHVLHFDDEPWDVTYIFKKLREIIKDTDRNTPVMGVSIKLGGFGPEDYPSKTVMDWVDNEVHYYITYWFIETADQLPRVSEIEKVDAFIIDVVRPDAKGTSVSVWRELLSSVSERVKDVESQVRLFTAFEVDNADEGMIATNSTYSGPRPPILKKGDPAIYDFILQRLGWC
jgi:hypothetical protein